MASVASNASCALATPLAPIYFSGHLSILRKPSRLCHCLALNPLVFPSQSVKSTLLALSCGAPWCGPWPNCPMSSLTTPTPPLPLAHIPLLLPQTFQTWSCFRALAPTLPSAWKALPLACSLSLSPTLLIFLLRHHPIQNAPLSQSFFPLILVCFSLPQGRKNFYVCLKSCFSA